MIKHIVGALTVSASLLGGIHHYHATHSPTPHIKTVHAHSMKLPKVKSVKIIKLPKIH